MLLSELMINLNAEKEALVEQIRLPIWYNKIIRI